MLAAGSCATAQYTPVKVNVSNDIVRNEYGEFLVHKVQPRETLFSISKAYSVNVNNIKKDNPSVANGLKTGDILLIRTGDAAMLAEDPAIVEPDEKRKNKDVEETSVFIPLKPDADHVHNISLIIPADSKNFSATSAGNNFLDFYHGFLIAMNDAKEAGISMRIEVIDNKEYQGSSQIVYSGRLDRSDLIIGPVFASEIEGILPFANEREIPVVSPMDPSANKFIEGNHNFLQISVDDTNQQKSLLSCIPVDAHVAVFFEKGGRDEKMLEVTRNFLTESGIDYKSISYGLLEGRSVRDLLQKQLDAGRENHVVVVSSSEAFVSDVLRNLNLINSRNGYKVTLYGLPRWRNFESVDVNYYHSMNLHLAMQYYVDYSREDVKRFLARYRALFGSEPTPYSFQAYDIGKYFSERLSRYGRRFIDNIEDYYPERLLQSDFKFVRKSSGSGLSNCGTRIVVYRPDYSVELLTPFR
jgi:LysM repeat protein/ABC-type branched-subunit amino acid transport system substrate-binding protein